MPSTTPQTAPASAKLFELNASPTSHSPPIANMKTGRAARCAFSHGTLTRRLHPVHCSVLLGPSVCFCQNEKTFRSHHGHAYIGGSLKRPLWSAALGPFSPLSRHLQNCLCTPPRGY